MRIDSRRRLAGTILALAWLAGGPGLTVLETATHAERVAFHTRQAHVDPAGAPTHADHCALGVAGPAADPRVAPIHRTRAPLARAPFAAVEPDWCIEPVDSRLPPSRAPPVGLSLHI